MIKRYSFTLWSLVFVVFSYSLAHAGGGWTQKKKEGFFKLSQYAIRADRLFGTDTELTDITTVSVYTTSLYGEYGITDKLTTVAYIPFFVRSTLNNVEERDGTFIEGDAVNSFGDPLIGLKYALVSNRAIALSATVSLGLPLGDPLGGRLNVLQTGDGEFNQMITLEASHSFYPKNAYATAMVGFNNRTKGFSEEFRYALEAGYGIKSLWIIGRLNAVKSLMNGNSAESEAQGLFSNNVEFTSVGLELMYDLSEKVGVSASMAGAVSGRQILASPAFDIGVFLKIK